MNTRFTLFAALLGLAILSGCGGGGNSIVAPPPASRPTVTISADPPRVYSSFDPSDPWATTTLTWRTTGATRVVTANFHTGGSLNGQGPAVIASSGAGTYDFHMTVSGPGGETTGHCYVRFAPYGH